MQTIDLHTATVTFKNDIIYVIFKEVPEVPATEILAIIKSCQEFSKGKPFCVLTDMQNFIEVTPEGREVAADRSRNPNLIANAVLVKKLGARLHAGVFQEVNRPQHPIEIFNDENEALEWLRVQQKKAEKSKIRVSNK
jgi:hypothetical protein